MYSNIANADYAYVDMKASDLREKIISQEEVSVLDIAKGCHTRWPLRLKYDKNIESLTSSKYRADIATIQKEALIFAKEELAGIVKELAKKKQEELLSEVDKVIAEMKGNGCSEYKGEDARTCVFNVIDRKRDRYIYPYPEKYYRKIYSLYRDYDIFYKDIDKIIRPHMDSFLSVHFGEKYSVSGEIPHLPSSVGYDEVSDINFSNVYMSSNDYLFGTVKDELFGTRGVRLVDVLGMEKIPLNDSIFGDVNLYFAGTFNISVKMNENEARLTFEKALLSEINDGFKMSENEYFRNTEISPVIVNQNMKTGKIELIDGYRRILTVSDPNLLGTTIPVKAYKDLSDDQFLSVLFAVNMWKSQFSDRNIVAFDRGFLFALKQRFGFEIPEKAVQLGMEMVFNSIPCELSFLYLYGNFDIERMKNHGHYVDDVKMLYSALLDCYLTKYPYDHQYNVELSKTIAETVGKIRETEGEESQSPLSADAIESLFTDEHLTKLFSKKTYSSMTYVANFFSDKDVYKYVENKLKDSLIPKEMACDKDEEEELKNEQDK